MRVHNQVNEGEQSPIRFSFCGSLRRQPHLKCLVLTLTVYFCLAASVCCCVLIVSPRSAFEEGREGVDGGRSCLVQSGYVYIFIGLTIFFYLVYIIEFWHSPTRIDFRSPKDASAIYQQIRTMKQASPIVWWRVVCYHFTPRLPQVIRRRRRDVIVGSSSSRIFFERKDSHAHTTAFDYTSFGFMDDSKRLINLEKHPATRVKFTKKFSFISAEAERSFREQRSSFFQEYERMDEYVEFTEGLDLLNARYDETETVALANPYRKPWYLFPVSIWIATILLQSWPLRIFIDFQTAFVHFQVSKVFGVGGQNIIHRQLCITQQQHHHHHQHQQQPHHQLHTNAGHAPNGAAEPLSSSYSETVVIQNRNDHVVTSLYGSIALCQTISARRIFLRRDVRHPRRVTEASLVMTTTAQTVEDHLSTAGRGGGMHLPAIEYTDDDDQSSDMTGNGRRLVNVNQDNVDVTDWQPMSSLLQPDSFEMHAIEHQRHRKHQQPQQLQQLPTSTQGEVIDSIADEIVNSTESGDNGDQPALVGDSTEHVIGIPDVTSHNHVQSETTVVGVASERTDECQIDGMILNNDELPPSYEDALNMKRWNPNSRGEYSIDDDDPEQIDGMHSMPSTSSGTCLAEYGNSLRRLLERRSLPITVIQFMETSL